MSAPSATVSPVDQVPVHDADHPLAGGGGAAAAAAAAASTIRSTAPARSSASASPPPSPRRRSDSDSDEEHEADLRRAANPFLRSQSQLAAAGAIPAPRPKSDWPLRTAAFWAALQHPSGSIDEAVVRRYVFDYGCPEQPAGARALLWKLLLGYLPWDRREWSASLQRSRATYQTFVDELTNNPFAGMEEGDSGGGAHPAPSPGPSPTSSGIRTNLRMVRLSASDDPLGGGSAKAGTAPNTWSKYYADNSIREEIEKDVRRTYSSFHFFQERVRPKETTPEEIRAANAAEKARNAAAAAAHAAEERRLAGRAGPPNLFPDSPTSSGGSSTNLFDEAALRRTSAAKDASIGVVRREQVSSATAKRTEDLNHHDVIKRILFIYAKLNPGIRYVQGMNELLAPIYYVFAHNATELRRFGADGSLLTGEGEQVLSSDSAGLFGVETAEADAFFCFTAVMSHMRDRFIKSLDAAPTGVLNVIANLNRLLKRIDYQLWAHLQEIGVDPRFYSFRWLTLILSQEFELPDVLRLWDSLFAAEPEASMESVDATASAAATATGARKSSSGAAAPVASSSPAAAAENANKKLIVEFLNDCCCAILCMIRRPLLAGDFSAALKLLQSAGSGLDVQRILFKAQEIQKIRRAGGGFVDPTSLAHAPPPKPLSSKDMAVPFEQPKPRPGEEEDEERAAKGKAKREQHIAMQNAVLPLQMPVALPVALPVADTSQAAETDGAASASNDATAAQPPSASSPSAVASAVAAISSTLHTVQDAVADAIAPLTDNLSL